MTVQEKANASILHYKELNEELSHRFETNSMFELKKQDIIKTLYYLAMHADCILIADTFTGRRFFNLAERWDVFYEFANFLNIYDFNYCRKTVISRNYC